MYKKEEQPLHYVNEEEKLDVIDIVKILNLNFNMGNVLKYITRYKRKGSTILDLKKAKEYIEREIKFLKETG